MKIQSLMFGVAVVCMTAFGQDRRFETLRVGQEVFADISEQETIQEFQQRLPALIDKWLPIAIANRVSINGLGNFGLLSDVPVERLLSGNVKTVQLADVRKSLRETAMSIGPKLMLSNVLDTKDEIAVPREDVLDQFIFKHLEAKAVIYDVNDKVMFPYQEGKVKGTVLAKKKDRVRIGSRWCYRDDMSLELQAFFWKDAQEMYLQKRSYEMVQRYRDDLNAFVRGFCEGNKFSYPYLKEQCIVRINAPAQSSSVWDRIETPYELRGRIADYFVKCLNHEFVVRDEVAEFKSHSRLFQFAERLAK